MINALRRLDSGILDLKEIVKKREKIDVNTRWPFRRNQTSVCLIIALDKWYIDNFLQNVCISQKAELRWVSSKPFGDVFSFDTLVAN